MYNQNHYIYLQTKEIELGKAMKNGNAEEIVECLEKFKEAYAVFVEYLENELPPWV